MHVPTGLRIELEDDPSGWVVAYTPELPGCVSQGETVEQALVNISDAICGIVDVLVENEMVRNSQFGCVSGSVIGRSGEGSSNPSTKGWHSAAA
jgi:predicted RNase H-like HicB family nuclease